MFHGRLAMLGFAAAVINEINTGLGPLGQVSSCVWVKGGQSIGDQHRPGAAGAGA